MIASWKILHYKKKKKGIKEGKNDQKFQSERFHIRIR